MGSSHSNPVLMGTPHSTQKQKIQASKYFEMGITPGGTFTLSTPFTKNNIQYSGYRVSCNKNEGFGLEGDYNSYFYILLLIFGLIYIKK